MAPVRGCAEGHTVKGVTFCVGLAAAANLWGAEEGRWWVGEGWS